jgi:pimeloyl-ACP methyl ester carboxylesterase
MKKPPIILIHGLRGDHHGLLAIAKGLEKHGYEVLAPDLPGSGDRADITNKSLDTYADWLHDYVKKCAKKPYVIGHSMGSIIVSHYLEKYPDDTQKKVVLLSPIFRTKAGQKSSNFLYGLASGALHILPKRPRYKFMKSKAVSFCISHFLTADKSQQKAIDQLHYKYSGRFASADSLLVDMKISMKNQTKTPANKQVLYVIGEKDRLTKAVYAESIAAEQHADFVKIEGTGHLLNYERPTDVAKIIAEYLI